VPLSVFITVVAALAAVIVSLLILLYTKHRRPVQVAWPETCGELEAGDENWTLCKKPKRTGKGFETLPSYHPALGALILNLKCETRRKANKGLNRNKQIICAKEAENQQETS